MKKIFIAVLLKNLNFFIYGEFYTTCIKFYNMSRNVVNRAAYMTMKWACIFVLNVKHSAVNARAIWMPKH